MISAPPWGSESLIEASVVSSVASTTVAANAGEDATLEFKEGEGDPNENVKRNWKELKKNWKRNEKNEKKSPNKRGK